MGDMIRVDRGGLSWHLAASLAEAGDLAWLLGDDGPRLDDWQAAGRVRTLKRSAHRLLYRVSLPQLDFHLKFYPMNDLRAYLRQLVRPSKARMEFDRAREVARRGVPTIEPLALAEVPGRPGASYFLSRTLPGTRSLAAFLENELPLLPPERAAHLRQLLARELGCFLAGMHEAGILHTDLHPGNLLFHLDDDRLSLYLVDLLACKFLEPLDWASSRANLSVLNRWFSLRSSPADRLRFWHAYREARGKAIPLTSAGRHERDLEASSVQSNRRLLRILDRRCQENNGAFVRVSRPGFSGHASRLLPLDFLSRILAEPDALFSDVEASTLKSSRSARVTLLPHPLDPERQLIWKRFAVKHWSDPLASLCRMSRAQRSWHFGHALRARDIPTPMPLLLLHRRRWLLSHEGYLLTESLPDALHLRDFLDHLIARPEPERSERLHATLAQLARVVARLHRAGFSQPDLKAANVLVSSRPWVLPRTDKTLPGEAPARTAERDHVWLIDLVGLRQRNEVHLNDRLQNLSRLYLSSLGHPLISNATRLRFLRAYLGRAGNDPAVWKEYVHGILAAARTKVRKNQRNGRAIS